MKKVKKAFSKWWEAFKADTPKIWKFIIAVSIAVPGTMQVIDSATNGTKIPQWYIDYRFYIIFGAVIIALIGKSQTTKVDNQ